MTGTKVVIFHTNYQEYLKNNCEITSKNNEIVIVGDSSVSSLSSMNNVEFVDYTKYLNHYTIEEFKKYFKPYNTTKEEFVWLWYLRVFITGLFMEDYNLDKIFHIDSDNILLSNVNDLLIDEENGYLISNNFDNPQHMTASIHSSLLSRNFFSEFIQLYEDLFLNKSKFELIEKKILFHEENGGGGICDMTLFYLLNNLDLINVKNLMLPIKNNVGDEIVFMNDLNDPEGYESSKQYKENFRGMIKILNNKDLNKFQIFDELNMKNIDIANIHFQGKAKKYLNNRAIKKYS